MGGDCNLLCFKGPDGYSPMREQRWAVIGQGEPINDRARESCYWTEQIRVVGQGPRPWDIQSDVENKR